MSITKKMAPETLVPFLGRIANLNLLRADEPVVMFFLNVNDKLA